MSSNTIVFVVTFRFPGQPTGKVKRNTRQAAEQLVADIEDMGGVAVFNEESQPVALTKGADKLNWSDDNGGN